MQVGSTNTVTIEVMILVRVQMVRGLMVMMIVILGKAHMCLRLGSWHSLVMILLVRW